MKKILVASIILIAVAFTSKSQAQGGSVSVNINIGSQPAWGPTGYDYVDYYYIPDIDIFYYVPKHQYVYYDGGRWIFTTRIPARYSSFDFYHAHKVVINEPRPYLRHDEIRTKYVSYKGKRDNGYIYNAHESKYNNYYKGNKRTQPTPPSHDKDNRGRGNGHH